MDGVSWEIDGVPILLPRDLRGACGDAPFVLLVFREEDAAELTRWRASRTWRNEHPWLRRYFALLPSARIVVFEEVCNQIEAGNVLWVRFETLPID